MDRDQVAEVKRDHSFVVVSELGYPDQRKDKMLIALAILTGVVAVAALNLVPIVVSAIVGCILLVLFGCLTVEEAHTVINWKIILLLAGLIPLGTAMEKTGAAELMASYVLSVGANRGPAVILSLFFFLAMGAHIS